MDNLVTVLSFPYPSDAAVIRGRLESEGIFCFLRDELSIQARSFYSIGLGGVKLQVKESDVPRVVAILKEAGYLKDEDLQPDKKLLFAQKLLSKIPFFKNLL